MSGTAEWALAIASPSPHRVHPPCPYFPTCSDLQFNALTSIPATLVRGFRRLVKLDLKKNAIERLAPDMLQGCSSLTSLYNQDCPCHLPFPRQHHTFPVFLRCCMLCFRYLNHNQLHGLPPDFLRPACHTLREL